MVDRKKFNAIALSLLAGLVIFGFGFGLGRDQRVSALDSAAWFSSQAVNAGLPETVLKNNAIDFSLLGEIWSDVKTRYIKQDIQDEKLFYGSLSGLVASLGDPYSVFFDPSLTKQFAEDLEGQFDGVGMEIGIKQDVITIVAPLPDTPAQKAGLMPGDKILSINSKDTAGMLIEEAVRLIRGPRGTKVKLLIFRQSENKPREVTVTRSQIEVQSVTWKWDAKQPRIAVITISQFNEKTFPMLKVATSEIIKKKPLGLIVDVRNNPGGYLDTAIDVASMWVEDGVVVTQKGRTEEDTQSHQARGSAVLNGIPTVALVNMGSASASEILAGALQDYGLAKIVGEKTYGKGSVQDYRQLKDGSSLKLTVAKWYTPKNRSINEQGISPDVVVNRSVEDFNQDKDPQYDKAIEILTGKKPKSAQTKQSIPKSKKKK